MDDFRERIKKLAFLQHFEAYQIEGLLDLSEIIEKQKGQVISRQFEECHSFYFLLDGRVNFTIGVENSPDEFSVGHSSYEFTPIGWSGFRSPYRYATTVSCDEKSILIKWSHIDLKEYFEKNPDVGKEFIFFVFDKSVILLNEVRTQLVKYSNTFWDIDIGLSTDSSNTSEQIASPDALPLLRKSPFFEIFPENILEQLAEIAEKRTYFKGDRLFTQGEKADGIDVLALGKVAFCFNPEGIGKKLDNHKVQESVSLRMIHYPGYIVGWIGSHPDMTNDVTTVSTRTSVVYHISRNDLINIINQEPVLALTFTKRLLWLVSILLQNARTRLISEHFEREITAINNLIEQNSTQLSVESILHKLPYLLKQVITLSDAFEILFKLENDGNTVEKEISKLCLDILGQVYKENIFFCGLKAVYQKVVDAPKSISPRDIGKLSAEEFYKIFKNVPHIIEGWENLPEEPGHIFIYNHLYNSRYYTLPNSFQMTLDSNFIKSMILNKKYEDPGVGVVRVPKAVEYAHQNYYRRLGHIYVYTSESEVDKESFKKHKEHNRKFYDTASGYIKSGINLMISPEGTSAKTEDSPGLFKIGTFRLAASIDPEPLIVPLVVANLDKRINNHIFTLIIKKPFRISDYVKEPLTNIEGLLEFLDEYRKIYKEYVQEAIVLSLKASSNKINLKTFERVKDVA